MYKLFKILFPVFFNMKSIEDETKFIPKIPESKEEHEINMIKYKYGKIN